MKHLILLIAAVIFSSMSVKAQEPYEPGNNQQLQYEKKFFLSLSGGASLPIDAFESKHGKDTVNSKEGFAKTGYNINLNFGYQVGETFGIVSHFWYSQYKLDVTAFSQATVSTDNWQTYGALIGPMLTLPAAENFNIDLKALGGIAEACSPAVNVDNAVFFNKKKATAFAAQFGADLRYNFNESVFVIGSADYNYMKPKFDVIAAGEGFSHTAAQKIEVINLTVGIGINF
ncbi:MAG TPA: outer membrane beta-barrel protein [Hanamia sp.]